MDDDRLTATRERLSGITERADLGAALRSAREAAGLSIRELARRAANQRPSGGALLRKNLIEDMERGNRIDATDDDRLDFYLSLCEIPLADLPEWHRTVRRVFGLPEVVGPRPMPLELCDTVSDEPINAGRKPLRRTAYLVLAVAAALLCSSIAVRLYAMTANSSTEPTSLFQTPPGPTFRTISGDPASAGSPPFSVAVTKPLGSGASMGKFALPTVLDLDGAGLAKFNGEVITSSEAFQRWKADNSATPVTRGTTDLTLTNTWDEPIRIIRMSAVKVCDKPLRGTYFQPPAEGGVESNIALGVDLDTAEGIFQEMYYTADGLHPAGPDYFEKNTITLTPGESQAFTIGAFVTKFSCTFKIRIFVTGKNSTVFQDVDFHGEPFRVTGPAIPATTENPYSGYGALYVPNQSRVWTREDPWTAVR